MEGKTHMLTAIAFYAALGAVTKDSSVINMAHLWNTPDIALVSLGAVLVGSIFPDMDMPGSTAGSKMTIINMKMVKLMVNAVFLIFGILIVIFSGNKYTLYEGSAILLFSLLSYKSITHKLLYILRTIVQLLIVGALIFTYIVKHEEPLLFIAVILTSYFFSKHRGFSHTLILSIVSAFCVYTAFDYYGFNRYSYYAAAYFFAGCFLHIYVNDYLTNKGVPNPLCPLTNFLKLPVYIKKFGICKKAFKESFKISRVNFFFTIDTGSTGEVIFSMACVVMIVFSFAATFMR